MATAEVAADRADQPLEGVAVERILAAEVEQHLRLRHSRDPFVVGKGEVAGHPAVLVAALGATQVHAYSTATTSGEFSWSTG